LKVLHSCTSGVRGTIANYFSWFELDGSAGGELLLDGGSFTQEGAGGVPPGNYPAKLLSTGELVPAGIPTLQSARYGAALVLSWPSGYQLLSATNVTRPYTPVPGASNHWTNWFTKSQEFFRLQ
jgi:hypothetical protein